MTDIGTAATAEDTDAVAAACSELADLIDQAKDTDPVPLASANTHWQRAITLYGTAAPLCQEGAEEFDGDKLNQASTLIREATTEIEATTRSLDEHS